MPISDETKQIIWNGVLYNNYIALANDPFLGPGHLLSLDMLYSFLHPASDYLWVLLLDLTAVLPRNVFSLGFLAIKVPKTTFHNHIEWFCNAHRLGCLKHNRNLTSVSKCNTNEWETINNVIKTLKSRNQANRPKSHARYKRIYKKDDSDATG